MANPSFRKRRTMLEEMHRLSLPENKEERVALVQKHTAIVAAAKVFRYDEDEDQPKEQPEAQPKSRPEYAPEHAPENEPQPPPSKRRKLQSSTNNQTGEDRKPVDVVNTNITRFYNGDDSMKVGRSFRKRRTVREEIDRLTLPENNEERHELLEELQADVAASKVFRYDEDEDQPNNQREAEPNLHPEYATEHAPENEPEPRPPKYRYIEERVLVRT